MKEKFENEAQESFYRHQAQTTPFPLGIEVERAEGIYLYTPEGKSYIDFISGISVANIGHSHPKVVKAIKDQVDKHMHVMVYGEYLQSAQYKLAAKLDQLLPDPLSTSYFVNSGTEAIEGSMKLAKRITGRTELIAFKGAYHGNTQGSLSISSNEYKKSAFRPLLPDIRFLEFNNIAQLEQITERTAGVIIEPVQGDAGIRIPSKEFMQALRKRCDETGSILIFDEIQSGFGRCGKWFAFQHFDVVPDILAIAKAFGGGMPIGAFIASYEHMKLLSHDPMLGHITTFGGHPVNCAAALANIEVLEEEEIIDTVEEKGAYIEKKLLHPLVKEIRRIGMFFAIEMDSFEVVNQVVRKNIEKGLISYWFLSTDYAFRIAPPLNITFEEIDKACAIIRESMDEVIETSNYR
jgi:acetylornithine/succinyldiaminopimelate/putrescine aminotransferase